MIDTIRLTFAALRSAGTDGGFHVRALEGITAVVHLGVDGQRRPHLLLHVSTPDVEVPDGTAAVSVRVVEWVVSGDPGRYIDVTCEDLALSEIFDQFAAAVVAELERDPADPGSAVETVLERWRQFLAPGTGGPGREFAASLAGELLVALDVLSSVNGPRHLDMWTGPRGGRHDFRNALTAVEVKTTRAHTARTVTIHGVDQLSEPEGGELFLHFVRLEDVPEGSISLPDLVDQLLHLGVNIEDLYASLAAAGVSPADLPTTNAYRFDVLERRTFSVGDGFPRLVPTAFVGGTVPVGVDDLTYRVDLSSVQDDLTLSPQHANEVFERLGGR